MAKLKYIGTISEVSLDWECVQAPPPGSTGIRCKIKRGDTLDVRDDLADGLVESGNFERVPGASSVKKKKEKED
ncbi:MAG: hypothetical protein COV75_05110 [Candidatus Omnitrophica bacterium CG11_big_fil_rev_8_21_14_0_20_63_9]|nr:MAG: hypothetical protein COV75_05110 [Candidatus Omnitrophica bacterium CG11_big_fil_rev_8_21_14_0_20_63_9]